MVALVNSDSKIVKINNRFLKTLDYSPNEISEIRMEQLFEEWADPIFIKNLKKRLKKGAFYEDFITLKDRYQRAVNVIIQVSNIRNDHSDPDNYLVIMTPLLDNKEFKKWKRLAYTDELTGLSNFRKFRECVSAKIKLNSEFGLLFIDIDNFKLLNDRFGHLIGDNILQICASRLINLIGDKSKAFRKSGDEFLVIVDEVQQLNEIKLAIIQQFKRKLQVGDCSFSIDISIGTSVYPSCGPDEESLIQSADFSMYEEKRMNKEDIKGFGEIVNEWSK
ncbi:MAG TPA: GGDEF domain-containing protein [Chondromyces sp.]|nr:GGDEF domain-containing protein [Chondromyces sp.]